MNKLSQFNLSSLSLNKVGVITLLLSALTACYELSSNSNDEVEKKAGIQLKESTTQEEFKQYLMANFTQRVDLSYNTGPVFLECAIDNSMARDSSEKSASKAGFSDTNNQVAGIDEADIWK